MESPSANLAYLLPKLPRKALPAHPDNRQILTAEANLAPAKFAGNRRICQGQGAGKIALTAGVLAEEREAAIAAGMNDFLAKPLNLETMTQTLERYSRLAAQ